MLSKFFPVPYSNSKWDAFLPYMLLDSWSISIIKMTSSINAFSYLTSSQKNKFLILFFTNLYGMLVNFLQLAFDIYNIIEQCIKGYTSYKEKQDGLKKLYYQKMLEKYQLSSDNNDNNQINQNNPIGQNNQINPNRIPIWTIKYCDKKLRKINKLQLFEIVMFINVIL